MVNLRRNGISFVTLSHHFNCHFTSIIDQCRKYHIVPLTDQVFGIETIVSQLLPKQNPEDRWRVIEGERINRGKSYAEYLKSR